MPTRSPDRTAYFITHPDVAIDPAVPVPQWPLSARGRERMRAGLAQPWMRGITALWSSRERKAIDGATILSEALGVPFSTLEALGENDRSATGFLPKPQFEALADAFFAQPEVSVRGWERAIDAQRRITAAFDLVLQARPDIGDVAIVSHGAVGTLLQCALEGIAISRAHDQPPGNGGYYFAVDVTTRLLRHGWLLLDAPA